MKTTIKDDLDALNALYNWLDSQEIDADQGIRVLSVAIAHAIRQIAKEEGLDPKRGGEIIGEMIVASIGIDHAKK